MAVEQLDAIGTAPARLSRRQIAWRAAAAIPDGAYVNLGIGLPTVCADHLPEGREIVLHSENGVLGLGPRPPEGEPGQGRVEVVDRLPARRLGGVDVRQGPVGHVPIPPYSSVLSAPRRPAPGQV